MIYAHTWQAQRGAPLHAVALVRRGGRTVHVLACNQNREIVGGHAWDYRMHGAAISSPNCGQEPCQRLFRDPEGAGRG